jgi:predicted site-specific integrase-resolvase
MPYAKPDPEAAEWMKLSDAAGRIAVDPRTLISMIRDGRLDVRVMRFDTTTRIHKADFEREIKKRIEVGAAV